jgi:hypothetical protein
MQDTEPLSGSVSDLSLLQGQIEKVFNLEERKDLCLSLDIEYENLAGETRRAKVRELVKHCHRYGRLADLIQQCRAERPQETWFDPDIRQTTDAWPEDWGEPLLRWYGLVKAFNKNRHQPFSAERTRQGDDIAYALREMAPAVFGQFELGRWLNSSNAGKRLAAVKYLDWLQDVQYFGNLLRKLVTESPFMQLHVLITLDGLVGQLGRRRQATLRIWMRFYFWARGDASREYWRLRIRRRLKE